MKISILFLFILSHMLADFPFQSKQIAELKDQASCEDKKIAINKHLFVHLFITVVLFNITSLLTDINFLIYMTGIAWATIFIIFFHFIIDTYKFELSNFFQKNHEKNYKIISFSLDQSLHFLVIISTWMLLFKIKFNGLEKIFNTFTNLSLNNKVILTCIIAVFCIDFSNFFIDNLLSFPKKIINEYPLTSNGKIKEEKNDKEQFSNITNIKLFSKYNTEVDITVNNSDEKEFPPQINFGNTIGKIERILIALFFITGINAGVVIIISIKTLTRFKAIEQDRDFSEYYLLGTLLSVLFGFLSAVILSYLWK